MATLSEVQAMEAALNDYRAYMTKILVATAQTQSEITLGNTAEISQAISDETKVNYARFIDRRNELVEENTVDTPAHVQAFCEGIYAITGSPLPAEVMAMNRSNDAVAVAGDVIAGTAKTIASGVKVGVPIFAVVALAAFFLLYRK